MIIGLQRKRMGGTLARAALLFATGSGLRGQTAANPSDVLARARLQIVDTMRRLPKYTCVETLDRSYFTRQAPPSSPLPSCAEADAEKKKGAASLRLAATDRVRLDVAEGDVHEIYSWPGASHFESGTIDEIINRGPVASGAFGGYLVDIFAAEGTRFNFTGQRMEGARRVFTYDYEVPQERSRYKVRMNDGWTITAYSGAFDIDAASLELLRISVNTPELPPGTELCRASGALEYSRVRIGDGDFLLPRVSQLHLVNRSFMETESAAVFTGCKEYLAESVLHVEGDDEVSTPAAGSSVKARGALPEGVRLTLRLNAPIDSDVAAAGDSVVATVTNAVREAKSNAVLFPAGAMVHGRIDRMEHWIVASPRFVIGIHWDSIAMGQDSAPFAAILDRSGQLNSGLPPRIGAGLARRPPPIGQPDALTFPSDAKRYVIPARYEMRWVTVRPPEPPKPGASEGK